MCETELEGNVKELKIKSIIGFDGSTNNGLIVHPNGKYILYPLGNKVVVQEWSTKKQKFLVGHTNIISSIAVSKSGKYIASGQINHIGFKAMVILWDFEKREIIAQHEHHKVRVEAVTFSKDDKYVITLGGRDCGSVLVWDIEAQQVLCGSQVARGMQGDVTVIQAMTRRGACFITAGEYHISVWRISKEARNVKWVDVAMSKLKRTVLCLDMNERDEFCYCGTTTGDVLKIRFYFHHDVEILEPVKQPTLVGCWARLSRKKLPRGSVDLYQQGVRAIKLLFNGLLIIGAGDGTVEMVEESTPKINTDIANVKMPSVPALRVLKTTCVNAAVTALQLIDDNTVLAATVKSEIYAIQLDDFNAELLVTCHTSAIYDIAFPSDFSEVFATAGKDDVRVWSTATSQELLRICVENFTCSSVVFSSDGKAILTGWNDGVIRSFTPLTGRLIYAITDAHNKGVSALTTTSHGRVLVSGGCEGQVRLWEVSPYRQELLCTLKEHRGPVSAIQVNVFDTEAASASTDGTCIIWDLERKCRRQILFAKTLFMCVRYFPTGVQILTGGSDRKLAYWEVLDGSLVRELDGSSGTINALDISPSGEHFVSGGNDQIVKFWTYQEGVTTHVGVGHAAVVTATRFSPDGRLVVTCDASGGVFLWERPHQQDHLKPKEIPEVKTPEVKTPVSSGRHEEDVRDLPSARSSVKGATRSGSGSCGSERTASGCGCGDGSSARSVCSSKSSGK